MLILGVDPGLTKTGLGIIKVENNSLSFVASTTIYTDADESLSTRLQKLHDGLVDFVRLHNPDEAAIEETFINVNPTSSLKLGYARGALILSLGLCGLKISEYSTTAIKKAVVGVGRADKNQIKTMIKILLPRSDFKSEDEADALAVAVCHNNNKRIF